MLRYCLAGISIESTMELPLPVLTKSAGGAEALLIVGPPLARDELPSEADWCWSSPTEATLGYPDLGKAWISEGRRILLRPCSQEPDAVTEWRGLIIPCFAALFHQRGSLSLHASAVCRNGVALGFMGLCGAGKSTLVAQLTGEGFRFLSDDLLLINADRTQGAGFVAHPGFSVIKLWEDAAGVASKGFSRLGRLYPDAAKDGFVPTREVSAQTPAPLRELFVIEEGNEVSVETLSKGEALAELLRHTYGVDVFGNKPQALHFRQCSELAAKVPVKRLTRPKNFDRASEVQQAIMASLCEESILTAVC